MSPQSQAAKLAAKLIRQASNKRRTRISRIYCIDCKKLPERPITGNCGHTRCTSCIEASYYCTCGAAGPDTPRTNFLVNTLVERIKNSRPRVCITGQSKLNPLLCGQESTGKEIALLPGHGAGRRRDMRSKLKRLQPTLRMKDGSLSAFSKPQLRLRITPLLLKMFQSPDVMQVLALVAANAAPCRRTAKNVITEVISKLSDEQEPRALLPRLYRALRQESVGTMDPDIYDCPICTYVMRDPVTAECGHTMCHTCINRCKDEWGRCPICSTSLYYTSFTLNTATTFIWALQREEQVTPQCIPLFTCTVTFPEVSCPIMLEVDYHDLISEMLKCGSRCFGIVGKQDNYMDVDIGTIVEVRDCLVSESGCLYLSTIGLTRFHVLRRIKYDRCTFGWVVKYKDVTTPPQAVHIVAQLAERIKQQVQGWFPTLMHVTRHNISSIYGALPLMELDVPLGPNGPNWLWWLIAVLPLSTEYKITMLSTRSIFKRLTAIARSMEIMQYQPYTYNQIKL